MGRGLIRSLFILVWEVLHKIFMEGLHGRILLDQVDSTNPASGMGRTRGAGAEFRIPGSREGSYTRMSKWKILFDYLNLAYFVYVEPWISPADVSNLVGKVYPSAEVLKLFE
jgi:hypothetical protein